MIAIQPVKFQLKIRGVHPPYWQWCTQFSLTSTRFHLRVVCSPILVYVAQYCQGKFRDHVPLYNEVMIRYDTKCHCSTCAKNHTNDSFLYRTPLVFVVECGIARFLCAMRVFEVRASSSSPRLPLCRISFLSRPPFLS